MGSVSVRVGRGSTESTPVVTGKGAVAMVAVGRDGGATKVTPSGDRGRAPAEGAGGRGGGGHGERIECRRRQNRGLGDARYGELGIGLAEEHAVLGLGGARDQEPDGEGGNPALRHD